VIVFNYAVRELLHGERRELNQILNFRRIEIREKLNRIEKKINDEIVNADLFSNKNEDYVMNRLIGVQKFIIDDSPIELPIFHSRDRR
jgi:hypothetical protein